MKKQYLNLSNVTFEVVPYATKKAQGLINTYLFYINRYSRRTILDAYKRPSPRKMDIYENWLSDFAHIAQETNGNIITTVLGSSSNFFSIGAYDNENKRLFYITVGHNYVIEGVEI